MFARRANIWKKKKDEVAERTQAKERDRLSPEIVETEGVAGGFA
jgi:hypothetical protein